MNWYKIIKCSIDQKIPIKGVLSYLDGDCYHIIKCPICGKYTFDSYSICENCGWEQEPMSSEDIESSANHLSIKEYRQRYIEGTLKRCSKK